MGRIVAIASGDLLSTRPLNKYAVKLAKKQNPNVLFIGTASQDAQEYRDVLLQSSSNNENTLFQRYCNWILQQNCNKFVCNNA